MTIIALHYTEKEFFAIADGLISKGASRVLGSDRKLLIFKPVYKIPRVGLGRFSHFDEYTEGDFLLGYAGTYSLVLTTLTRFRDVVARLLFLERDKKTGKPTIYQREDAGGELRGGSYCDSYNFTSNELPKITVNLLMGILERICRGACVDFATNAMQQPDAQFFIFGHNSPENRNVNHTQVLKCRGAQFGDVAIERYSVLPWTLDFLGDIRNFDQLRENIEQEQTYSDTTSTRNLQEYEEPLENSWLGEVSRFGRLASNRHTTIKMKILQLICDGTETIGGDSLVAEKSWSVPLHLSVIQGSKIPELLESMANKSLHRTAS